jgi:FecR protein
MRGSQGLFLTAVLLTILALVLPVCGSAQEPGSHARIVRISFVEGTVQYNDQAAIMNSPVIEDSRLATGTDGLVEVEFEDASKIRLASETKIKFAQLARLSTGEAITRVDLDEGEAEFLIPASSAGHFAVNVKGKNLLFTQPGRFRILSTDSAPLEIVVWKGEATVRDLETGKELSVADHETFALNPADLSEYDLQKSVLADDLDRWSEQRDETLRTNYVASTPSYTVYNQYYQSGGGYSGGYVPPYVYDVNAFGCPGFGFGFWQPFGFGSPGCFNSGFFFSPFFNPFLFSPPVFVVVNPNPPIRPRRPVPIRPPAVPTVAKGGPTDVNAQPRFRSFNDQPRGQRVFNDETFQRTPQVQPNSGKASEATHTPVIAPGQRTGNSNNVAPPTHAAPPAPTHVAPPAPAQAPHSSPPASRPPSHASMPAAGPHGPSGGGFSHGSGMGMGSHSAGASHGGGGHR